MSEERKPVMCRCGKKMSISAISDPMDENDWYCRFVCVCGASTSWGKGKTEQQSIEAAYLAATRRPLNRATEGMSSDELCALMDEGSAIVESCVAEMHRRTGKYCSVMIEIGDKANISLTEDDVFALDDMDAVWVAYGHEISGVVPAVDYKGINPAAFQLLAPVMLFSTKPTPADIEAARKEHANE